MGVVIITSAVFGIGFYAGVVSDFMKAMMNMDLFEKETVQASENLIILEMISDGRNDKAVNYLNLKLDGQVLLINNLLPEIKNDDNKNIAENILLKIANYRKKYPGESSDDDIKKTINDILQKAIEKGEY
jgi:hypothetical protein